MKQACIFDLDGTLTDTLDSITYSVNGTMERMDLPTITREQCKNFVGFGAKVLIEKTLLCVDGKTERLEEAMAIYREIFQEYCTYQVRPYDGVVEALRILREKGIHLAVLSNKPHQQTLKVVEEIFGSELFEVVCGQQEGIPRKPDPTAAKQIAKGFGLTEQECLYIGDSDVDMQTGKAAKMRTVGVTWGFRSREVLREHGADVLVESPREWITIVEEKES